MPSDALAPGTPAAIEAAPTRDDAAVEHGSLLDRRIWRDAALAWLAQHLFFLFPVFLNSVFAAPRAVTLQRVVLPWLNWDGWIYVDIAQHGYRTLGEAAFFPLYPLIIRLIAFCLGGHTALAALLVANASSLGAYALLLVLVEREAGTVAARRTLLFLLCFPAAFFLAAAYTEALFLLLSLAAFCALRRHAWRTAGILIALASLTRPVGILLLLPLAVEAYPALRLPRLSARCVSFSPGGMERHRVTHAREVASPPRAWEKRASLLLPIVMLAGYCGFLALRFGRPLGFLNAEGGTWGRRVSWPWDSITRAGEAVLRDPPNLALPAALDLLLMALFITVTVLALRRLPFPFALYMLASLALIVLLPMHRENWGALSSNKRFMVDVFPLFMAFGMARPRRWIEPLTVILALLLQVLLAVVFLQRGWVA